MSTSPTPTSTSARRPSAGPTSSRWATFPVTLGLALCPWWPFAARQLVRGANR